MLIPVELRLQRLWLTAGFDQYCCAAWSPLEPSGYDRQPQLPAGSVCGLVPIKWAMSRAGSITAFSVYVGSAVGNLETVHLRVRYGGLMTPELLVPSFEQKASVVWLAGVYTFSEGNTLYVEHYTITGDELTAGWVEAIVEVTFTP